MDYKQLLKQQANAAKVDDKIKKSIMSRGAVSNRPLLVNDIICFPTDLKEHFQTIGNNSFPMVSGVFLDSETDTFAETKEAVSVGLMSFGREYTSPVDKSRVTPENIAKLAVENLDTTKLLVNNIRNKNFTELVEYLKGKKLKLIAMQSVALVLPDGTPRLNEDKTPQFQTIYAFMEI